MAENGPFGTPFLTPQNPPKKVYVGPFLRSFQGNEAHKLFLGAQNGGFWVGAKKFMLKTNYVICGLRVGTRGLEPPQGASGKKGPLGGL